MGHQAAADLGLRDRYEARPTGLSEAALFHALADAAEHAGERPFAILDGGCLKYRELLEKANDAAEALSAIGVRKGDLVAVLTENGFGFFVLYFALAKLGAVLVPMHSTYDSGATHKITASAGIGLLLVSKQWAERHSEAVSVLEVSARVLLIDSGADPLAGAAAAKDRASEFGPMSRARGDVFALAFTSGSTGSPKGVVHTQHNVILNGYGVIEALGLGPEDRFLFNFPVSTLMGLGWTAIVVLVEGSLVLMRQPTPEHALHLIQEHGVTVHNGSVDMFLAEVACASAKSYDLASLRTGIVGGQVVDASFLKAVRGGLGLNLSYCYGMTEMAGAVTLVSPDADEETRHARAGKPLRGAEIRIVDDAGRDVERGQPGEVLCRAPFMALGYWVDGEVTPLTDAAGWFATGDVGRVDEQSHLRVLGRKGDRVSIDGRVVLIPEIELTLMKLDGVRRCIALAHNGALHVVVACEEDSAPGDGELTGKIVEQTGLRPESCTLHVVDALPLTASGKPDRVAVAQWIVGHLERVSRVGI
ncbi:MAG TPA: class I adenylate-forming enzyme family protein [Polyangiaceae bacterium]